MYEQHNNEKTESLQKRHGTRTRITCPSSHLNRKEVATELIRKYFHFLSLLFLARGTLLTLARYGHRSPAAKELQITTDRATDTRIQLISFASGTLPQRPGMPRGRARILKPYPTLMQPHLTRYPALSCLVWRAVRIRKKKHLENPFRAERKSPFT